jgi:hypothetical protein
VAPGAVARQADAATARVVALATACGAVSRVRFVPGLQLRGDLTQRCGGVVSLHWPAVRLRNLAEFESFICCSGYIYRLWNSVNDPFF